MKIGILTFHKAINYGAYLQAYSLSNQLKKVFYGADVEIIDYIAPREKRKIYLNILRTVKHYGIISGLKEIIKIRVFNKSLKELSLSKKKFCRGKLKELFMYIDNNYDLLVIGSDAIFNWNQNGYPSAFIPQYRFHIPVITYAASVHGLEYKNIEQYKIKECKKVFSSIKLIGTRDINTENFVKFCKCNKPLIHCCDPTVFMDFDLLYTIPHRLLEEIMRRYKINIQKDYIVLMLEDEKISKEIYTKYAKEYTVISLFKNNRYADVFLYDLSPVEWAMLIRSSKIMVTNFFHGALLALTQSVPALVIDLSGYDMSYESKLKDLMLRRLDLEELYIKKEEWNISKTEILDEYIKGKYQEKIKKSIYEERNSFKVFENLLKENIIQKNIQL